MKEINTIYWNRKTLNTAYIFFLDSKKLKETIKILKKLNIGYSIYLEVGEHRVYGVKMFRVKRNFLKLVKELKRVMIEGGE